MGPLWFFRVLVGMARDGIPEAVCRGHVQEELLTRGIDMLLHYVLSLSKICCLKVRMCSE
ncbi:hypothetical protein AGR1C_Lc20157 [Agrobacterium fabacearum TT111]|nr:hypothetical protein AGR1C_Lc20157 [Agrobacterium fabacearum TT111]